MFSKIDQKRLWQSVKCEAVLVPAAGVIPALSSGLWLQQRGAKLQWTGEVPPDQKPGHESGHRTQDILSTFHNKSQMKI